MFATVLLAAALTQPTLTACGHPDYPPWNWRSGEKIVGVCAEVTEKLFNQLGFKVDLTYVGPWQRCQQYVERGLIDINICAFNNPTREKYSDFTQTPMGVNETAVFVNTQASFPFKQWSDLSGRSAAMIRGVSMGDKFDTFLAQHTEVTRVNTLYQVFGLLEYGRVDFVPFGRQAGKIFLAENYSHSSIVDLPEPLQHGSLYISISKLSPHTKELAKLEALLQSPEYLPWVEELLGQYSQRYLDEQSQSNPIFSNGAR